jgi:hypothetical protein
MTTLKPYTKAAALKGERERDKAQAMRDYEAEGHARHANLMRLRALRLARESAAAQTTPALRPIKKKAAIRGSSPTRARGA